MRKRAEKINYDYEMSWYDYKDIIEGALSLKYFIVLRT